jgi:tetratricopeptide (TPR) repeat protein/thiol-disulfide isomerase/thioredoxin
MRARATLSFTLAMVLATNVRAQNDTPKGIPVDLAAAATARVKAAYFAMDYIGGVREADSLRLRFPKSRELAAWRVANLARVDRPAEARAAAAALLAANRTDPWGWFAQTFVAEYATEGADGKEPLSASLAAYQRAPKNPDIMWLRAFALSNNAQSVSALALIDTFATRGSLTQEMKTLRATAMFGAAGRGAKMDTQKLDSAFALYARARESDPNDATAYTFAASRLMNSGRYADAYSLARRGTELSPTSLAAHENYWRVIDGLKERSQASRDSEALADVEVLLQRRGGEPTVLASAARQFQSRRQADRARELEDRITTNHPTSVSAEWVFVNRYRALDLQRRDTTAVNREALVADYRKALWAFVDRPTHVSDRLLGDAYRQLFAFADSATNPDTLLRIVRGMVKYEGINPHVTHAEGAIRLAEVGRDFKEAEQVARDGLKAGKARIDGQRDGYETVGDYARALDWMSAFMYDALGVVYMRQGKLGDAEKQLVHARELDPKSIKALYHLGQLAEKQHRLDDAEQFYIKGSLLATPGANANKGALQALYRTRKGSLDGYGVYVANLNETDRANRKADIAKTRASSPRPLAPFRLRSLDGTVVSLDSVRGKTTVINNWGMWCGPCVAEMPELQNLATKYASDSTVRILTIDNDPNTDELRSWMQKKGYTFTTLVDDGYLSRSNMHTFPTTWFLDPSGRVVFTKTGWSEKVVEEFTWRIDMIRGVVP